MSNIRAITGSTRIMNRPTHGGSKKQGIPSSTNLNTTAHVAFRNRNVLCSCNRHVVFCMNQLGGVGAGGVPGNSYMFAPSADGVNKNKILCGINHKNIRHPSQFELIYSEAVGGTSNPLLIDFFYKDQKISYLGQWRFANDSDYTAVYSFITGCYNSGSGEGNDVSCYDREVVGYTYIITFKYKGIIQNVSFLITEYTGDDTLLVKFLGNPSKDLLHFLVINNTITITKAYKSTYKVNV